MVNIGVSALTEELRRVSDPHGATAIDMLTRPGALQATPAETKGFYLILSQLFTDNKEIRAEVKSFMSQVKPPPDFLTQPEVIESLNVNGTFYSWMMENLSKGELEVLDVWSTTLKAFSGVIVTSSNASVKLLNNFLAVVEKAFKHPDDEIRKSAFKAWIVLMDCFAEDQTVFRNIKRIKLITRPLVGALSNRSEDQVRLKFDCWWHFMGLFKEHLSSHADDVIIPFLSFCYLNVCSRSTNNLESPAKRFTALRSLCLEAMAVLIAGLNNVKVTQINYSDLEDGLKDGTGLIAPSVFVRHCKTIIDCVEEAFTVLRFNIKPEVTQFCVIISTLGGFVKDFVGASANSTDENSKEAVTQFLRASHGMLLSIARRADSDEVGSGQATVALTILDVISKFPASGITSNKLLPAGETAKPIGLIMLQTMFSSGLVNLIASQSEPDRNRFNGIFERFISPLGQQRFDGLIHLEAALNLLSEVKLAETQLTTLWRHCAKSFEENIVKFNDVNQSTNKLEVNLSTSEALLLFPFTRLTSVTTKQVWTQWSRLYKLVNERAEMIALYQNLSLEGHLAGKVKDRLSEKQITSDEFSNICRHLCETITPALKQQLSSQSQGTSETDIGRGRDILQLLAFMASLAPDLVKEKVPSNSPLAQSCKSLCKHMCSILDMTSSATRLLADVLGHLSPAMATLLDPKVFSTLGSDYQSQAELLFDKVINAIQARYEGPFSDDFLARVKPFLICAFSHHKTKFQSKVKTLWEITWAKKLVGKDIPEEIQVYLMANAPTALTEMTSSSASSIESPPVPVISTPTSFRSFLDRSRTNAASPTRSSGAKETPTKFAKPAPAASPASASKRAPNKKTFFGLEDENSADFVKISPASKKRRPLTDHQKEKLTTRNDDIPALYSEVSRDDMSLTKLPSVFDSQMSMDESSMMAVDATDIVMAKTIEIESAAEPEKEESASEVGPSHESKRKQARPHKMEPVVKRKRGRKRKCDEISGEESGSQPESSQESVPDPKAPLEKKVTRRGRPKKSDSSSSLDSSKSSNVEAPLLNGNHSDVQGHIPVAVPKSVAAVCQETDSPSKPTSPSHVTTQVGRPVVLKLNKLDILQSPVRVIQEDPLIVVPSPSSTSVVRKIEFTASGNKASGHGDQSESGSVTEMGDKEASSSSSVVSADDDDVIGSSQEVLDGRRRKRRSLDASLVKQRSSTRRVLATTSGNVPEPGKATATTPASGGKSSTEVRNKHGETELHVAVKRKNKEKVMDLLTKGASVNTHDYFGWTPLHESINDDPTSFEILKLLVEHNADVNAKSSNGQTPLHDAVKFLSQNVVDFLLENGADPDEADNDGKTPRQLAPTLFAKAAPLSGAEPDQPVNPEPVEDVPQVEPTTSSEPEKETVAEEETEVEESPTGSVVAESLEVVDSVDLFAGNDEADETTMKENVQPPPSTTTTTTSSISKSGEATEKPVLTENGNADAKDKPVNPLIAKPLIKPPLPFSSSKLVRASPISKVSRASLILEMAKAKSTDSSSPTAVTKSSSLSDLMSPKPEVEAEKIFEDDLLTTPTQAQPWRKYAPSPMDASPSVGILKRHERPSPVIEAVISNGSEETDAQPPANKRRRVQFKDPPVSSQVEIPRESSGKATRLRQQQLGLPRHHLDFASVVAANNSLQPATSKSAADNDSQLPSSIGSYESTQPTTDESDNNPSDINPNCLYPSLAHCDEPVATVMKNLTNRPWEMAARNNLQENQITTIGDLAKLSKTKSSKLKFLKPPNNVDTIRNALRIFAKTWTKRQKDRSAPKSAESSSKNVDSDDVIDKPSAVENSGCVVDNADVRKTGIASIVEESTPEEEDETMREIYDRPSPTPPSDEIVVDHNDEAVVDDVDPAKVKSFDPVVAESIEVVAVEMIAESVDTDKAVQDVSIVDNSTLQPVDAQDSVVVETFDKEMQCEPTVDDKSVQHVTVMRSTGSTAVAATATSSAQCDVHPFDERLVESFEFVKTFPRNQIFKFAMSLLQQVQPE